jgi:hypothetical protein
LELLFFCAWNTHSSHRRCVQALLIESAFNFSQDWHFPFCCSYLGRGCLSPSRTRRPKRMRGELKGGGEEEEEGGGREEAEEEEEE